MTSDGYQGPAHQDPLHLLFICPTVAGYIGGTETVVSQFCQRLRHKARLTLLSGEPGPGRPCLIDSAGMELRTLPFAARDSRLNRVLSKLLMTSPFKIESRSFFRSLQRSGIDLAQYDRIVTFYEADAYLLAKRYPALRERCRHFLPGVSMRGFFKQVPASDVFYLGYRAAEKTRRKWGLEIASLPLGVDERFFRPARRPIRLPNACCISAASMAARTSTGWPISSCTAACPSKATTSTSSATARCWPACWPSMASRPA